MKAPSNLVAADSPELIGRIPYKLVVDENGNLFFRWIFIGDKSFSEPFFGETISHCFSRKENVEMPFTSAETLFQVAEQTDAIAPTAFIFHVSRCGSTLLTQMLDLDERNIVLAEVPLLDAVIRLPFSAPAVDANVVAKLFCAVLRILGKKRTGKEKFLFVKTDSWHLLFFETIRKMFPFIPALLLYRSPKEVMRSQKKQQGMHAVKGPIQPEIFGFTQEQIAPLFMEEYLEMVMECYFQKCVEISSSDTLSRVLNYRDGAMDMLRQTVEMCGIKMNEELLKMMEKRTLHHSKRPGDQFELEEKLNESFPKTKLDQAYDQLEKIKEMQPAINVQ